MDKTSNDLSTSKSKMHLLSHLKTVTILKPKDFFYAVLPIIFLVRLFFANCYQVHLSHIDLDEHAFDDICPHEFTHNMRHTLDFHVIEVR